MNKERYERQILMFGEAGQRKIEDCHVAVVGVGGIGLQVCQSLAYLGIKRVTLVDDDKLDETNMNRAAGATHSDIGRYKVDIARDMIVGIRPEAHVATVAMNLRTRVAFEEILRCSVIFGCVDHDGPRLVLNELSQAYEIPLIDVATEILPNDLENVFGGRVVVSRPGDYCLFCADQIDSEIAKSELESSAVREARHRHGYGLDSDQPAPAVIALNGVLANAAVIEFLVMETGIREPARRLTYKGMRPIMTNSIDKGKDNCWCCSLNGTREEANIWRYLLPESE